MSMNYKQTSCHVTQLLYLPTAGQRLFFFGGFFEETRKLSGRPHWGKEFWTSLKEMKRLYPKMEEFLQLRKDLDPKGTFVNEFLGKLLKLN
jgi:L-gulonolactone oxidase